MAKGGNLAAVTAVTVIGPAGIVEGSASMTVDDGELGRLTSAAGLTVGSTTNSHITVDGLTETGTDTIGTVTLRTMQDGKKVQFANAASSFNKGITIQAVAGIDVASDATTKASPTVLWTGTGTLTVANSKSFATTDQILRITADDTDIDGPVDTGAALLVLECTTTARTVRLGGSGPGDLKVAGTQHFTSTVGMTIGADGNCGDISSAGSDFAAVTATVSVMAVRQGAIVDFSGGESSFHDVKTYGDSGVKLGTNAMVKTTAGDLLLDGDADDDSAGDSPNKIIFGDGATVQAKLILTLEATLGSMQKAGALTLEAGSGMIIEETLASAGGALVINTDFESAGVGVLTVAATKNLVTQNGDIVITAFDTDLKGGLDAGSKVISVHASLADQTMRLGSGSVKSLTVSDDELQRIAAAGGLVFGATTAGDINIGGVSLLGSGSIGAVTTVFAQGDDAQVKFDTGVSSFNSLVVQADNGINVTQHVTATGAHLHLDGDMDNSNSDDIVNKVQFSSGITIRAKTLITLEATAGILERVGALTMEAGSGVVIWDDFSSVETRTPLVINTDYVDDKVGTFTVAAGKVIDTNEGSLTLTAWDVELDGGIITANGTVTILTRYITPAQAAIGIGSTAKDMQIEDSELGQISTTGGLTVGSTANGDITVAGVTIANSDSMGTITLISTGTGKKVSFADAASTFEKGIVVQAISGIDIAECLTTKELPTVLRAGLGSFTIASGKTVSSSGKLLLITTDDMELGAAAKIDSSGGEVQLRVWTPDREMSVGVLSKPWHLSDTELGMIDTATSFLTIGDTNNGNLYVSGVTAANSGTVGTLTLQAMRTGRSMQVVADSTFNKGIVVEAKGGVVINADITLEASATQLSSGSGTLTIATGKTFSTTDQQLTVIVDDVDLNGAIQTGLT